MRVKGFGNLFIFSFSSLFGVLLWLSLPGEILEKNYGLKLLSYLRESKPPPAEARVIPINKESADELGEDFSSNFKGWKRSHYAKVVDRLSEAGVSVIVIDVFFKQKSQTDPAGDEIFIESLSKAGNVILLKGHSDTKDSSDANFSYYRQEQEEVHKAFREASYSTAHSVFGEKNPIKTDFSTFPTITERTLPSIFIVALHLYYSNKSEQWGKCIKGIEQRINNPTNITNIEDQLAAIYQYINKQEAPLTQNNTHAECGDQELTWLENTFRSKPLRQFNIYDKVENLQGPSFYELTKDGSETKAASLKGKAVFIGFSEKKITDVSDKYYYLGVNGQGKSRINGVDLQAISFLNLLHNEDIRKINLTFAIILLLSIGIIVTLAGNLFKPAVAMVYIIMFCIGYGYIAVYAIDNAYLWMPLFIPLFIQAPMGISISWLIKSEKMSSIVEEFKKGTPLHVTKSIESKGVLDTTPRVTYAVCLHSDIEGYSTIAESFSEEPDKFKQLESEYWEPVFEQIIKTKGEKHGDSGDDMTCIWKKDACENPYLNACQASISILQEVEEFNRQHPKTPFKTRIGLNAGKAAPGLIGIENMKTDSIGDIANIAARLENDVNKLLGTKLIASEVVINGLPDISNTRCVGTFILRGRSSRTTAYEIYYGETDKDLFKLKSSMFDKALQTLQLGDITTADRLFRETLVQFPDDGPSKFYRKLIAIYLNDNLKSGTDRDFQAINLNDQSLTSRLRSV